MITRHAPWIRLQPPPKHYNERKGRANEAFVRPYKHPEWGSLGQPGLQSPVKEWQEFTAAEKRATRQRLGIEV